MVQRESGMSNIEDPERPEQEEIVVAAPSSHANIQTELVSDDPHPKPSGPASIELKNINN